MYKVKINTGKNGIKEFNMILKDEPCPICGKPLGYFTWNMFHGEVTSHCCGAILQIKDFYVDEDYSEEYRNFVASIGKDEVGYRFEIAEEWIPYLKRAIVETEIYDIHNKKVFELANQYKEIKQNYHSVQIQMW